MTALGALGNSFSIRFTLSNLDRWSAALSLLSSGSIATPGFTSTRIWNQFASGSLTNSFIMVGRKISVSTPGPVPWKAFGATPTTWYTVSFMRNVRPTIFGS